MKSRLPNLTDYVRLHPPYASFVEGRTPAIQWHGTRAGAARSAFDYQNTNSPGWQEPDYGKRFARKTLAVLVITPTGDLETVESYAEGEEIPWRKK